MNQKFILKALMSYCCLTGVVANAQTSIEPQWYQKITTKDSAPTVKFGGIAQDSGGNYIYTSTNGFPEKGTFKAIVTKTDESGNQIWRKEYADEFYTASNRVFVDSSDNIFVSGEVIKDGVSREAFLRKYDSSGNPVCTKFFQGNF